MRNTMYTTRRNSPLYPKCQNRNTYDIIPELPNEPNIQLNNDELEYVSEVTLGNAKYCIDCNYSWKKYRGKKIYDQIRVVYANAGGFPGPYFEVKIDLESLTVENNSLVAFHYADMEPSNESEDFEWFRSELYKSDLVNWAEEYNSDALDGTHWSVRIEYDTHCEIKRGSNHSPPKWTKFCKAVSKVCGSEFY